MKPMNDGQDWACGYVTEVVYTRGYYRELCPLAQRFALIAAGWAVPRADRLRYCELGFGQGLSLNFHAASQRQFDTFGFDINPTHVAIADELARESQSLAQVFDDSFAELLERDDLPEFDYISLHGVWSWISDENRHNVVEFIRRKLKVGGVVYVSYNSLPGWAQAVPLRRLLTEYAHLASAPGNHVLDTVAESIAFAQRMAGLNTGFFQGADHLKTRLETMGKQPRNYLVHEYFNRDWDPMYFADVAQRLSQAKLEFAAPVSLIEQIDGLRIPPAGMAMLAEIKQPLLRETVRDYLVNQQFRRDLFIRGARRLSAPEQRTLMDEVPFVLQKSADTIMASPSEPTRRGVPDKLRAGLVKVLDARQGQPIRMADLLQTPECAEFSWAVLRQALMILVGSGELSVANDETARGEAEPFCRRLNQALCAKAGSPQASQFLCSPVTAGGVMVGEIQQMMLLHHWQTNELSAHDLAAAVWQKLSRSGQRLISAGAPCETPERNLTELEKLATQFASELTQLKRLGI